MDMQHGAVNFGLFNPSCAGISFMNNIVSETANALDLLQDSCSGFVSDFNDFFNTRPLAVEWNQSRIGLVNVSGNERAGCTLTD